MLARLATMGGGPALACPASLRSGGYSLPMDPAVVRIDAAGSGTDALESAAADARLVNGSSDAALELASRLGRDGALPGKGETVRRWELFATLAAHDLTAARVAEFHLDALAILSEADEVGVADASASLRQGDQTWGVFAAESGTTRLEADCTGGRWTLRGTKPWCSLADRLTRALVTAHVGDQGRRLFAVDLTDPRVQVGSTSWVSRGLAGIPSGPVHFDGVPTEPVGECDWYLDRAGFAWGAIGVAACWFGGAAGLARRLTSDLVSRLPGSRQPDQIAFMHAGAADARLYAARAVLAQAAVQVDNGDATGPAGSLLALRVRHVVADAAESTITEIGHALGPAPMTFDEEHARRVADLQVYLRQHHAERDSAALGRALTGRPA